MCAPVLLADLGASWLRCLQPTHLSRHAPRDAFFLIFNNDRNKPVRRPVRRGHNSNGAQSSLACMDVCCERCTRSWGMRHGCIVQVWATFAAFFLHIKFYLYKNQSFLNQSGGAARGSVLRGGETLIAAACLALRVLPVEGTRILRGAAH